MAQVSFSQMAHAEQVGDAGASASGKNQGTLKAEGKDYHVFVFSDSEAVTEAIAKFLQEANSRESPPETLLDFEFVYISQEMIEVETEIEQILKDLAKSETAKGETTSGRPQESRTENQPKLPENSDSSRSAESGQDSPFNKSSSGRSETSYSSIFSLARSFYATLSKTPQKREGEQKNAEKAQSREEGRPTIVSSAAPKIEQKLPQESRFDREGNGKQDRQQKEDEKEGSSQHQEQNQKREQKQEKDKKGKIVSIGNVQAARGNSRRDPPRTQASGPSSGGAQGNAAGKGPVASMENIYIRFMALMARILGQAELEAHQLYLRIKERTDAVDVLTLLISKINSEKGAIDWSNNEEMKKLLEKARAIGVDIPEGKFTWSEEEKKLLKENIQMRKDSMEKMTQLERTDMQRYLQEASQCHQARSNVLKLLKEVIDTVIHNMRPG